MTVRLTKDLSVALEQAANRMQRKSSEIVRMALRQFLGLDERADGAHSRVEHLIRSVESGMPEMAERHRQYILESLKGDR